MTRRRILVSLISLGILVASGLVQGIHTDRWGRPGAVETAAARLRGVPVTVGDWSSREVPIGDRQLGKAGAVGSLSRRYVNRDTGEAVNVMILCGRSGPISVHPPTVCLTGAGWVLATAPQRYMPGDEGSSALGEFQVADFEKESAAGRRMRTYWAWTATGTWRAPDTPRLEFARREYLYKMYVLAPVRASGRDSPEPGEDAAARFMRAFLPEVRDVLLRTP